MSDMADVLMDHHSKSYNMDRKITFCLDPTCCWEAEAENFAEAAEAFARHQRDMLSAAGFGPVQAARAEALDDAADAADDPSREDMDTYFLDQSDVGRWLRARAVAERGEG